MKKNILVNYVGRTGGGAAYAYEMVKGMIASGANVYAIISRQADNYDYWKKLPLKKIIVIDTYTNKIEFLTRTLKFIAYDRFFIKNELCNVNISAIYVPMGTYWSYLISRQFPKIPVYYTLHDPVFHSGEHWFNKLFHMVLKLEVASAHKIIILSKELKQDVVDNYRVKSQDVIIIPHPVFETYKQIASNKKIVEYNNNKINFLFFGRIEYYKGLDDLLEVYKKLENKYPNIVSLTIAGKGDIKKYESTIKSINNINIINKMIPDEDVASLFKGSKIVTVLPYKDATQSGVVNIAFMFESLVIATNVGALSAQLGYGKCGLLIPKNNSNALYHAMCSVVENYAIHRKYVINAKKYIDDLNAKKLAKKLLYMIHD